MKLIHQIILTIVLILLVLCIIGYISVKNIKNHIIKNVYNNLELVLVEQKELINHVYNLSFNKLIYIKENASFRNHIKDLKSPYSDKIDNMRIILNSIKISDNLIRRIDILSLQGNIIISTDSSYIGKNYANNKIFKKSLKYDNVELVTLDNECNIVNIISGPIYYDDKCVGVLMVYIDTDEFNSILDNKININKVGYTTLIKETGRKGILIISNKYNVESNKRFYFTNENKLEKIYATQIDEKKHEIIETTNYNGNKIITVVDYIDYCNMFISVRYSRNEVTNIFSYVNKMFSIALILLFIFVIFLILVIYKQIITPLKRIVTFVKKINSNIKPNILKVNYKSEFGELGSGLNKMGDILTANIKELKIVTEKHDLLIKGIEQIEECFLITDENGIIQYVNPAFLKVTGYSEKELKDKRPKILQSEYHNKKFSEGIWNTLMSGKTWKGVFTNKRKNGEAYKDESTITPIKDSTGKIIAFIILEKDIAEKEKMENGLRQTEKMTTIGNFASGIAHDFNNVLAIISGNIELAKMEKSENIVINNSLNEMLKGSNRGKYLIKKILDFTKHKERELKIIHIQNIVENSIDMIKAIIPSTVKIEKNLSSKSYINGDETDIYEIITNLSTNAYQAMKNNKGTISLGLTDIIIQYDNEMGNLKKGTYIKLVVSDTGKGMSEKTIKKSFDPYFTTKTMKRGTGLGLSIVYNIVRNYGGLINVKSKINVGTTFEIYIPTVQYKSEEIKVTEKLKKNSKSLNILFIDDDESLTKLFKELLKKIGHNITAMNNSINAFSLFKNEQAKYNVIFTDLTMPGLTGIELAEKIREINNDIPIIIYTGYGDIIQKDIIRKLNIHRVMIKPVKLQEIIDVLEEVIKKNIK